MREQACLCQYVFLQNRSGTSSMGYYCGVGKWGKVNILTSLTAAGGASTLNWKRTMCVMDMVGARVCGRRELEVELNQKSTPRRRKRSMVMRLDMYRLESMVQLLVVLSRVGGGDW